MKIAFLHVNDIKNKLVWSGAPYSMYKEFKKSDNEVIILKPIPAVFLFLIKVLYKIKSILTGKNFLNFMNRELSLVTSWWFGKQNLNDYDLLIVPAGSSIIARLETTTPIIYVTDVTFKVNAGYNTGFMNLHNNSIEDANSIEYEAFNKASIIAVPSNWAYNSVLNDYDIDPSKVIITEFGANFDILPTRARALDRNYNTNHLKLLFIGRVWKNKGGDIAYETFKILKERGLNVSITFVGSVPPYEISDNNVRIFPFLDKNNNKHAEILSNLYLESHFHILPTRSDAFGMVFCEASAHGLPSISTDTGGVSNAVRNEENGYCLSPDAKAEEYADLIQNIWQDKEKYRNLVLSSRNTYEKVLNWTVWRDNILAHYKNNYIS